MLSIPRNTFPDEIRKSVNIANIKLPLAHFTPMDHFAPVKLENQWVYMLVSCDPWYIFSNKALKIVSINLLLNQTSLPRWNSYRLLISGTILPRSNWKLSYPLPIFSYKTLKLVGIYYQFLRPLGPDQSHIYYKSRGPLYPNENPKLLSLNAKIKLPLIHFFL